MPENHIEVARQVVWCENVNAPAHGNGPHFEQPNCRNPHDVGPAERHAWLTEQATRTIAILRGAADAPGTPLTDADRAVLRDAANLLAYLKGRA